MRPDEQAIQDILDALEGKSVDKLRSKHSPKKPEPKPAHGMVSITIHAGKPGEGDAPEEDSPLKEMDPDLLEALLADEKDEDDEDKED